MKVEQFLEPGETLGTPELHGDFIPPEYVLWPVTKDGRGPDDRVLLEIISESDPVVLMGGNPLHIETMHGRGRLTTVDLGNGNKDMTTLREGKSVDVPAGTIHFYENYHDRPLVVRDTSLDFDVANEVRLSKFVQAIIDFSPITQS